MPTNNDSNDMDQKAELYLRWVQQCPHAAGLTIWAANQIADGHLMTLKVATASGSGSHFVGCIYPTPEVIVGMSEALIKRWLCAQLNNLLQRHAAGG
jgi:hypothetical protein